MRLVFSAFLTAIFAVFLILLLRDFQLRRITLEKTSDLPATVIVFTGQYDRIYLALELFDQERTERVFISGANSGAGIKVENFAAQFDLSSAAKEALTEGRIVLAPRANTTLQNAIETACWLETFPGTQAVTLITNQRHMPRASLALERALGRTITVVRISPEENGKDAGWRMTLVEFTKFTALSAVTLLPRDWWSDRSKWGCT